MKRIKICVTLLVIATTQNIYGARGGMQQSRQEIHKAPDGREQMIEKQREEEKRHEEQQRELQERQKREEEKKREDEKKHEEQKPNERRKDINRTTTTNIEHITNVTNVVDRDVVRRPEDGARGYYDRYGNWHPYAAYINSQVNSFIDS